MARILVNYIYNKVKDEYKILEPDCVYADQKIAVLETEEEINRPLVVPNKGVMVVIDRDKFELVHKKFHLISDKEGNVEENPNGLEIWLPKDTDISQLKFINGQLVKVEEEQKKVKKTAKQEA